MQDFKDLRVYGAMTFPHLTTYTHGKSIKKETTVQDEKGNDVEGFQWVIEDGTMNIVYDPAHPVEVGDKVRFTSNVIYEVKKIVGDRIAKGDWSFSEIKPRICKVEFAFYEIQPKAVLPKAA